jgi:hypothetical protein
MIIFVYYINIMSSPPPAPKKVKKRQPSMYRLPSPPKRRSSSVFSFESPMYGLPGFNYGSPSESPLKKNKNSPSILTNQKDAKPGRKVKQLRNAVVKSYDTDTNSQKSLANELAVYKHLDTIMYSGKIIRDLINERFMELNNTSKIYPGVNLIFPSIMKFENNQLYLTYHHIEDVFIKGTTEIMTTTILGTTSTYETDPVYNPNDLQLLENIKTALKENGIIYADNDLINGEIMSNLFRTNDGNALLLDFETSEVKTFKGGRKKTNRKINIKKRTRKKRNIKKN